ncbi:MAG: hypothetical protein K0Q46_6463 [Rhodococcus erythropolis]|jgi:hypothetical protein|nr:hypothetical protein [Rhodococcus erythropolis]MDF2899677.1 hypothetical protein [Rhodococcus erythropolis]
MTSPTDEMDGFIENSALRWAKDRNYRAQLMKEAKPRVGETLKKIRERRAA